MIARKGNMRLTVPEDGMSTIAPMGMSTGAEAIHVPDGARYSTVLRYSVATPLIERERQPCGVWIGSDPGSGLPLSPTGVGIHGSAFP